MDKKTIPGPAYIIIGAGVVLMSVFVGINSGDIERFALFILIGAVFIVVGFLKILMREKKSASHHATHHAAHPHSQSAHKPAHAAAGSHQQHPAHSKPASHIQHSRVVRCSSCGVKIHPLFKWCPNCGQKLK